MLDTLRDEILGRALWTPRAVQCIEAWRPRDDAGQASSHSRVLKVQDGDIQDWLAHKGGYAPPADISRVGSNGAFRLVICDRPDLAHRRLEFAMSRESFLAVEAHFQLSPATIPSFNSHAGVCSRFVSYDPSHPGKCERLQLVMKTNEHLLISNYALSLTYDSSSRTTNAILFYTHVVTDDLGNHLTQLQSLLSDKARLCGHPMLIPAVLLCNLAHRSQLHLVHDLDYRVMRAEATLGVTKLLCAKGESGKTKTCLPTQFEAALQSGPGFKRRESITETKVDIRKHMVQMNSDSAACLFVLASLSVQSECAAMLKDALHEIKPSLATDLFCATQELNNFITYTASIVKNLTIMNDQLRARFQAQSNVLYSYIAQTDNQLSAELTARSGRDSVAMKTLALITALFLPGTYVASFFSMGMFEWGASGGSGTTGPPAVSRYLWIYWVVTIPLTVVVVAGWRAWWRWEKRKYDAEVANAVERVDRPIV